ncbi:ADP-ribosylglycohydrolase [Gleimia coleocanis DSM 15436]|uniref:ADP-ribosylglycohydrolase n=2 Tax=Gleimia TaxID=2692113 RepID=C0W1X5_9ACTO|nr:ADP-ribosylglycohydrolase [Gleimia coleocanis DSM 15436]
MPVEFKPKDSFPPVTGFLPGGKFQLPAGHWTDDTALALCISYSLIKLRTLNLTDILRRFQSWYETGENSSTGKAVGVGQQTLQALSYFSVTGNPPQLSVKPALGNGSLMRLAPVVLAYASKPDLLEEACAQSSLCTHPDEACLEGCVLFGKLIHLALLGYSKADIFTWLFKHINDLQFSDLTQCLRKLEKPLPRSVINARGYFPQSLQAALWAFQTTDSFAEGALLAVNLGEDADTVGAIYGQLAGAYYSIREIPSEWIENLAKSAEIRTVANQLYEVATEKISE